jgi:hypothetical protein
MTLRAELESVLDHIPIDFGGGCSVSKAAVMAELIRSERITRSIDIGVYRGRSFFPQAHAHKTTGGKVVGIDPYSNADAEENDHAESDKINDFIRSTDFEAIFNEVDSLRTRLEVADESEILRMRSHEASAVLEGMFGLIHIDGNHDTHAVVQDVVDYLPLLAPGGFVVMDDISWPSVKPAVDLVSSRLTLIYARVDSLNDYAVFWDETSRFKKKRLRLRVAEHGEG